MPILRMAAPMTHPHRRALAVACACAAILIAAAALLPVTGGAAPGPPGPLSESQPVSMASTSPTTTTAFIRRDLLQSPRTWLEYHRQQMQQQRDLREFLRFLEDREEVSRGTDQGDRSAALFAP